MFGKAFIFLWLCVASLDGFVISQGSGHWRSTGVPVAPYLNRVVVSRTSSEVPGMTKLEHVDPHTQTCDISLRKGLIRVQSASDRVSVQCFMLTLSVAQTSGWCVWRSPIGFAVRFSNSLSYYANIASSATQTYPSQTSQHQPGIS